MSAERPAETVDLIEPRLRAAIAAHAGRPFVLGLCGAQGSGKSTVAAALKQRLEAGGLSVALLSLDDLYLSGAAREALMAVHPLLRTRGVPGTHDVALGEAVIDACGRAGSVALPRFAKEADEPYPEEAWERIAAPVDVLLFEGWCVGAAPQPDAALVEPVNALERSEDDRGLWRAWVNRRLATDYRHLFARIDFLVLLAAPGFDVVATWRRQQEHDLRGRLAAAGRGAGVTLDDAQIDRFVQHYQRITEHILAEMPDRADLVVALDRQRRPIAVKAMSGRMP